MKINLKYLWVFQDRLFLLYLMLLSYVLCSYCGYKNEPELLCHQTAFSFQHNRCWEQQQNHQLRKSEPEKRSHTANTPAATASGVIVTYSFFLFDFCKKQLIRPEGESMTSHQGRFSFFCSSQRLLRLHIGPLKGKLALCGASGTTEIYYNDTVRCVVLGTDVWGHCQK